MSAVHDLSIVIPVLDDGPALERLLQRIGGWPARPAEVLVVAASPVPEIERLCRAHGCRIVPSVPCRGAQLDDGARAARARTLWFLHADAAPPQTGLQAIAHARDGGAESGCFRFRFTGARRWQKRWIERLVALRVRCGGIPYGDQGLWADRRAYRACGGFAREPLFEEVRLVRRLRSRRGFVVLSEPIGVSARRWERDGWWLRSASNRLLALGHALGVPTARLAARYDGPMDITRDCECEP